MRAGSAVRTHGFQALLRIPQGVAIFSYMAWGARGSTIPVVVHIIAAGALLFAKVGLTSAEQGL